MRWRNDSFSDIRRCTLHCVKKHGLNWNLNNMRYNGIKDGYVFCFSNSIVNEGV